MSVKYTNCTFKINDAQRLNASRVDGEVWGKVKEPLTFSEHVSKGHTTRSRVTGALLREQEIWFEVRFKYYSS
jgi:hypothetical protein